MKPESRTKPRPKVPSVVNGQQGPKGQDRPPSPKLTQKDSVQEDAVEVEQPNSPVNGQTGHSGTTGTTKINASSSSSGKTHKDLDRWKQKAKDLEAQRDALSKQLEELFQIRRTEPEQLLDQLQVQYEERAKTQDALIKELTSQLARVEPLSRTGQAVALHFLTREAADEEKRVVEQDMSRLQEIIKEKDGVVDEKTKRIAELEQSVRDAIRERDAEVERSKELLSRAAPKGTPNARSHTRRPFGTDDAKMTAVIKFYEDMSNVLVTNVKFETGRHSEELDIVFYCIYTQYEVERPADEIDAGGQRQNEKSIVFTMRVFSGFGGPNGEPASEDDSIQRRVKYTPLELERESEDFVKKLEYMADSFTFPFTQQALFLNSLREKIRDATSDAPESGSEIDGMEVGDRDP